MKKFLLVLSACGLHGIVCSLLLDAHIFGPAMTSYLDVSRGLVPFLVIMGFGIYEMART